MIEVHKCDFICQKDHLMGPHDTMEIGPFVMMARMNPQPHASLHHSTVLSLQEISFSILNCEVGLLSQKLTFLKRPVQMKP